MSLSWYRRLTAFTAFCVWAVIVLGGMVRVTGSGTGCGESWPLCHGRILPSLDYHELVEWNHRFFASLVGLLMIVTVGSTLLWYRKSRKLTLLALAAAVTYLGQAILGGITVLLHLDNTWVAAHMGNSMLLLASLTLLALFARLPSDEKNREAGGHPLPQSLPRHGSVSAPPDGGFHARGIRAMAGFLARVPGKDQGKTRGMLVGAALVATFAAMLTGSAVVGNGADLACPAWPQCSSGSILPTINEGFTDLAWINFGHRLAVGVSDVLMLALTLLVWRFARKGLRIAAHLLALLYVSQVFLGAFTIWLGAPEVLRGAHLALAAATWSALVALAALVWNSPNAEWGMGNAELRSSAVIPPEGNPVHTAFAVPHSGHSPFPIPHSAFERVRLYFSLIKPRVIPLLLVPTVASMLMAAVQHPPQRPLLPLILFTMLGGTLATAGAHAINQFLDRDIDAKMRRTRRRPVVTHSIEPRCALGFGIALSAIAFVQLGFTVNAAAALLALSGNLFYVFVYTAWLKRRSVQNIVIGGAAGAVPPLVGWAAVTGGLDIPALLFFAIIFFWTPAHFWALALVRQEDYRAANIPMLPVVRGEAYTRRMILRYSVLLLLVSLLPIATHSLSWLYLVAALGLGLMFAMHAAQLARGASISRAWGLFKFSNVYLALLYVAMVLDRVIALGWGRG